MRSAPMMSKAVEIGRPVITPRMKVSLAVWGLCGENLDAAIGKMNPTANRPKNVPR